MEPPNKSYRKRFFNLVEQNIITEVDKSDIFDIIDNIDKIDDIEEIGEIDKLYKTKPEFHKSITKNSFLLGL